VEGERWRVRMRMKGGRVEGSAKEGRPIRKEDGKSMATGG
jgi:hypothetical protein